jgi:hypothetical protein
MERAERGRSWPSLPIVAEALRGGRAGLRRAAVAAPIVLVLSATALWAASLTSVDVRRMGDVGLASVLPPATLAAGVLLAAGFCVALHQGRRRTPAVGLYVVVLVAMLYGTTALVEEEPRFSAAWRLAGVAEYVMRNGAVDPLLDAFFNWPAFFILVAFAARLAGLDTVLGFAVWAPVFFNLLYIGPLVLLLGAGSTDRRLVWLGVWLFLVTNWVGQDYLAP